MLRRRLISYWSASPSSCLALYRAREQDHAQLICLVTTLSEGDDTPCPFIPSPQVMRAQADALRLPLLMFHTQGEEPQKIWAQTAAHLKIKYQLDGVVFGHTHAHGQKTLLEHTFKSQNFETSFPLEGEDSLDLFQDFVALGFKAKIVALNEKKLHRDLLGQDLDKDVLAEFEKRKIDVWGKGGEYCTIVYDGPCFFEPILLKSGEIALKNGYWKMECSLS